MAKHPYYKNLEEGNGLESKFATYGKKGKTRPTSNGYMTKSQLTQSVSANYTVSSVAIQYSPKKIQY